MDNPLAPDSEPNSHHWRVARPSEGEVEDFFHTLIQQDLPDEIHVYASDFDAHVAEELKQHMTLQERSTIPVRVGDCHRRHMPFPPDAAPITHARISSSQ